MAMRVASNDLDPTDRTSVCSASVPHPEFDVAAVGDPGNVHALAKLLSRDSVHGPLNFGERSTMTTSERHAKSLPSKDLVIEVDVINAAFRSTALSPKFKEQPEYSEEPLVSRDIVNSTALCISDSQLNMMHGDLVRVFAWYDKESGYAGRLTDLAALVRTAA